MAEQLAVGAELTNGRMQFIAECRSNPAIVLDYNPPLGDGEGYTPLELLLVSLATCSGATLATLLRKMRKDVASLQVRAQGTRRETHPTAFEHISLSFRLLSQDASEADVQRALKLAEDSYCPVWSMLKNNVEVTCAYQIVAPGQDNARTL
jgi:putative redox protein